MNAKLLEERTVFKIGPPARVEWVRCAPDAEMPTDADKCGNQQPEMNHLFESQHLSGFLEFKVPQLRDASSHIFIRTSQHKGHPHPVLSRSTPGNVPLGLSPKISR